MDVNARGLPITLDLDGCKVLLVGDGDEAAHKLALLGEAGAIVTQRGAFDPADLDGARVVLLALRDPSLAATVFAAARTRGVLCWCSDDPARSDFAMPAIARLGAARIAVSTSGHSPALASHLRATFEQSLGPDFARFVDALGALRTRLQRDEPDPTRRRTQLTAALDGLHLTLQTRYPAWFK